MTELIQNNIEETTQHTRMQYNLAKLGSNLCFNINIAINDRNRLCDGNSFKSLKGYSEIVLNITGNLGIQKIIGYIDLVWSMNNSPKYVFEIEDSTNIHKGIGRISHIIAANPDTKIITVIVYPDERKSEIVKIIDTPIYNSIRNEIKFLSYSKLMSVIEETERYIGCMESKNLMELILDSYKQISEPSKVDTGRDKYEKPTKELYNILGSDITPNLGKDWLYHNTDNILAIYKKDWKEKYPHPESKNIPFFYYRIEICDGMIKYQIVLETDNYKKYDNIRKKFRDNLKKTGIQNIDDINLNRPSTIYSKITQKSNISEITKFIKTTHVFLDEISQKIITKTNHDVFNYNVGESEVRNWDNYVKYGFISAGQGTSYRNQMLKYNIGDIFIAYFKDYKRKLNPGYVGIGKIKTKAKQIKDVYIGDKKLISLCGEMSLNSDNVDMSEYVCEVEWIRVVNKDDAKWDNKLNLFRNPLLRANIYKNQKITIEYIEKEFGVDFKELLKDKEKK